MYKDGMSVSEVTCYSDTCATYSYVYPNATNCDTYSGAAYHHSNSNTCTDSGATHGYASRNRCLERWAMIGLCQ